MLLNTKRIPELPGRMPRMAFAFMIPVLALVAQVPNPTQKDLAPANSGNQPIAVFHVDVVSRTMKAVNYNHRKSSTTVDFRGTSLLPDARGEADVDSNTGATRVNAKFSHLQPAAMFGPEFVTYVLWAITPEGRAKNLGEVYLNGTTSSINTHTDLQAFGLLVTAEPYYAVSQPSDVVVMENFVRHDTNGTIEEVDAKFELLQRGVYTRNMSAAVMGKMKQDKTVPLDLQEARIAVLIATNTGADKYAADTMLKATQELQNAEGYFSSGRNKKEMETVARQATQMAEDARIITLKKMEAQEKQAGLDRESQSAQEAQEQTRRRAIADAERMRAESEKNAALAAKADALAAKADAQAASLRASSDRDAAEKARMAAIEQQKKLEIETANARAATDEANRLRDQAEKDKIALREQIRLQLNMVLETRDSARGLIVNMSDVLFDTGKYTLQPGAKEKLAKVSGIVLAHPGLMLEVEGHTDSIGGDEYNQTLSEHRAQAVRDYLTGQGIPMNNVTAKGFGKTVPVATNDTADGRQRNRRVEIVVSGDPIANKLLSDSTK